MDRDQEVCLCFHVSLRKLQAYLRNERPRHASQLSNCLGAGTGCGWCRPYLERLFQQANEQRADASGADEGRGGEGWNEGPGTTAYAERRQAYLRQRAERTAAGDAAEGFRPASGPPPAS